MNKGKIVKTLSLLSITTLATINVINRISFSIHSLNNNIDNEYSHFYEWRFGKFHYIKKGAGKPLLLIHDLDCGNSSYEFNQIIDKLSETNEVFAIDLIGYGISEKINITYNNYLYVQLITDFIKNIIGRKTTVITSGNSSSIAIMACHNDNDIINNIICFSPQSLYQSNLIPTKQTKILKLIIDTPIIGTLIYNILASKNMIKKRFTNDYFYDATKVKQEYIDSFCSFAHMNDYKAKFSYSSIVGRYMNINIIHALKQINNNIILISGAQLEDYETIIENYKFYNSSIESLVLNDCKKYLHMEKPNELCSLLEPYI